MTDLTTLAGLTYGATNVDETLLVPDFSDFNADGDVFVPSSFFSSDYDSGITDTQTILSVDTSTATNYRLGTLVLQDTGPNGFKNTPETFDIIAVNNGQILLGTGYVPNDGTTGNPGWQGGYTLLSNTNLSTGAGNNPNQVTFPIGLSNTDADGAYQVPNSSANSLVGLTFQPTNVDEGLIVADTSKLVSQGIVSISSSSFSSDADSGIQDTQTVLSVDLSSPNQYRLGTLVLQDTGPDGFKNTPETFDIIGVNNGQVLIGDGFVPQDAQGNPTWESYTLLSNTNISISPSLNPNPPTFPIEVARNGAAGSYSPPGTSNLASLIDEPFASTNVNEGLLVVDTSKLASNGTLSISSQFFASDADSGIKDQQVVLSVDTDAKTSYRLGTLVLQDIGPNGFRNVPQTFDIIAVNGSQVLLGQDYVADDGTGNPSWSNYTFLSNTNISISPNLNSNPPTFPIELANNGADGLYSYSPPCFAAGTRIATPDGERLVEDLREGDLVTTISGEARPVTWVGRRRVDCRLHEAPATVLPMRIRAGAFAPNVPVRDLIVSPDHAIFHDGHLIPAKVLENGTTVVQLVDTGLVRYHHVELDRHDILLAEGLPAETYLDTGNRSSFSNARIVSVHADFARFDRDADTVLDVEGCAPMVFGGQVVDDARAMLAARSLLLSEQEALDLGRLRAVS